MQRLQGLAKAGRLPDQDLKGGTITVSNVGTIGGTYATPLINLPEVAIVALGKVQTLPRYRGGELWPVAVMQVSRGSGELGSPIETFVHLIRCTVCIGRMKNHPD